MLRLYGIISAVVALAALFLIRERPASASDGEGRGHVKFTEGFRYIFGRQGYGPHPWCCFFIGLGVFNAVSSMVDSISGSLGVTDSDGMVGVLMIAGGNHRRPGPAHPLRTGSENGSSSWSSTWPAWCPPWRGWPLRTASSPIPPPSTPPPWPRPFCWVSLS